MDFAFFNNKWFHLVEPYFLTSSKFWPNFWLELEHRSRTNSLVFVYVCYDIFNSYSEKNPLPYPLAALWTARELNNRSFYQMNPCGNYEIFGIHIGDPFLAYRDKITHIKDFIRDGYSYQVNYTFPVEFSFRGNPMALFSDLFKLQPTSRSGVLHFSDWWFLSLSPELFFQRRGDYILVEPMKGTWSPGDNCFDLNEKISAENVMIVDMVRNELGRICDFGTIKTKLFIKKYLPTVIQLVSQVYGRLKSSLSWGDIFRALFPPASVTGAPKLETCKIISQLEDSPRGIYTGTMGILSKNRAKFSVCIRTIELNLNRGKGRMGIGSGITWDSTSHREYKETLTKAKFFFDTALDFNLIETMRLKDGKIKLLNYHMRRLYNSAKFFGFRCNISKVVSKVERITFVYCTGDWRLRLVLNFYGEVSVHLRAFCETNKSWRVKITKSYLPATPHVYHKTTRLRGIFDKLLLEAKGEGFDEVLLVNANGFITQGCITNVFVKMKDGYFHTPEVKLGLLPGVLRSYLIEKGVAIEHNLPVELLTSDKVSLFVGNALRGLIPVREIEWDKNLS